MRSIPEVIGLGPAVVTLVWLLAVVPASGQEQGGEEAPASPEVPAVAPEEAVPGEAEPADPQVLEQQALADGVPLLDVSLRSAIDMAISNNLTLKSERIRTELSALDVMASFGIFDPVVTSNLTHTDFEEPTSSALDTGGTEIDVVTGKRTAFDAALRQRFFTGTIAELTYDQTRSFDGRAFQLLNPSYRANLGVTVTQPVLKGIGPAFVLSDIRTAKTTLLIANEVYRQTIEDIVFQVIEAYWNLAFAEQDVRVKRESLDLAENEVRITESKVRLGLWAQLELDQALTEQYSRRAELVQSQKTMQDALDVLRRLLFRLDENSEWAIVLNPTDTLKEIELGEDESWLDDRVAPNWEDSIADAFEHRPEIRQARLDLRNKDIEIARLRNELLPTLDLTGTYTWSALSEEFNDNVEDVWDPDPQTWVAGFSFEFPLGNRAATSALRKARLDRRRLTLVLRDEENRIVGEVRESIRAIDSALERIRFTHRAVVSAEKQLNAAESRRDRGFLTNFEVLEFQRDLEQADQNRNDAWREYRLAVARLARAQGTLTMRLGIELLSAKDGALLPPRPAAEEAPEVQEGS